RWAWFPFTREAPGGAFVQGRGEGATPPRPLPPGGGGGTDLNCGWGHCFRTAGGGGGVPSTLPRRPGVRPTCALPPGRGNCGRTAGGGVRGGARGRRGFKAPA